MASFTEQDVIKVLETFGFNKKKNHEERVALIKDIFRINILQEEITYNGMEIGEDGNPRRTCNMHHLASLIISRVELSPLPWVVSIRRASETEASA